MAGQYEPLEQTRYQVEQGMDGETIRIPPRKRLFVLLFLPVWLAGWSFGGIAAIHQYLETFEPFLAIWLCGWAIGWVAVAGILAWMIGGAERLSVIGGDLQVTHSIFGFSRRWLYQGGNIRHLEIVNQPPWPYSNSFPVPFIRNARMGSIRFDYGARTCYIAAGLDEAEARQAISWLARRLPMQAVDG